MLLNNSKIEKSQLTEIIGEAKKLAIEKNSENGCFSGSVGCIIKTKNGKLYKGVSIDCNCGIGFCGEHSAIAAMLTDNQSEINMIVAINNDGKIYPPCGRCREMMYQVNKLNLDAKIILSDTKTVSLRFLLPMPWQDAL